MIPHNRAKKKLSKKFTILSIISIAVVTIVWQAITRSYEEELGHRTYAANNNIEFESSKIQLFWEWDNYIDSYKQTIDHRLEERFGSSKDPPRSSKTDPSMKTWEQIITTGEQNIIESQYTPFSKLQALFNEQHCLEINSENKDMIWEDIRYWALQHCLLELRDIQNYDETTLLTHSSMRTLADRIGFEVKMEYASDNIVKKEDLTEFIHALQQHHNIGDIPSTLISSSVKLEEYLFLLNKILSKKTQTTRIHSAPPIEVSTHEKTTTYSWTNEARIKHNTTNNYTSWATTSNLKNKLIMYISDVIAEQTSDTKLSHQNNENQTSIWLNKEAVALTKERLQSWLGRS